MNARYYGSYIYRMLTPDSIVPNPANPQSFNRYSYVFNSPINLSDPSGHSPCEFYCPGDYILPGKMNFGAGHYGTWDIQQQEINSEKAEALTVSIVETSVGVLWEPADWAIAASDGFQWYDSLGMLPLIPASWGDNLGRFVSRYSDDVLQSVRIIDNPTFRKFTYRNFRENLSRFTGFMPTNEFEAHHILPRKFSEQSEAAGFVGENSIHNPLFGAWVQKSEHQGWTRAYQDRWDGFFRENDNATMDQILNFAKSLAEEYGFDVYIP